MQKSVNLSIPRKPARLLVSLALVLKKISAIIDILGEFVLVYKVQDIALEETGVVTGILLNMHIRIIHKVDTENSISTIISTLIF